MGWHLMAATVYTQADIDAAKRARADAKGARVIQMGAERVEFRDDKELDSFIAMMEREVNATTIQRHRYASTSKGF